MVSGACAAAAGILPATSGVPSPEKVARFNREWALVAKRWPDILQNGDPYYNPNLTLRKSDFSLRDLLKEKIGEPYKVPDLKEQ